MPARSRSLLVTASIATAIAASACAGASAKQCPAVEDNAGTEIRLDLAKGTYEVSAELDGGRAVVTWEAGAGKARATARATTVDGRWVAIATEADRLRVTECWSGGSEDGKCAELGPPRGGTLVVRRDDREVLRLALVAPVGLTLREAGCPTLHAARAW